MIALVLSSGQAQGQEQPPAMPAAAPQSIINDSLPLPDNSFAQTLKVVGALLRGKVTAGADSSEAAQASATTSMPASSQSATPQVASPSAAKADLPEAASTTPIASPNAVPPDVSAAKAAVAEAATPQTARSAVESSTEDASPVVPHRDSTQVGKLIDELISAARTNDEEYQTLNTAVLKWSDWRFRLSERTKDMLNYACLFKGVSPSSEAGDVILDEKSKLKSLASAKYQRQKLDDQIQLKVTSSVLDLAMHLGHSGGNSDSKAATSAEQLNSLVGKEAADKALNQLQMLLASDSASTVCASRPLWNIAESKARIEDAVARAARVDPIISDITDDIHHYNKHSVGVLAAHRVARIALSVASMTPDLVGPVTNTILFAYITVTGGTEQEKILRELYIDKRLTSRANLLGEQAHLAFYNYQLGALTGNKLLMQCARQIIARMTDADSADQLLRSTALISTK